MRKGYAVLVAFFTLCLVGCIKPYDKPEFQEVGTNETGFLIPLEGKTSDQVKFDSLASLKQLQVATKRVQIVHRWNQTGRWTYIGEWISVVRLVKVNRSPVTREWTAEDITGTGKANQAIWAESKDSIGYSTGISITSMIQEEDAAKFLYLYPSSSLEQVLDTEARARVQMVMSNFGAIYDMSDLRGRKNEMMDAVRTDLMAYYKDRGVTIATIAQFGGFAYENKLVQDSIDKVFIAQREKEVAAALLEAQRDKNLRVTQEAEATGLASKTVAQGIADGKAAILKVAQMAATNPVFLQMQYIEVERARVDKWNGIYPSYYMSTGGTGGMSGLLLSVPAPGTTEKQ